MTNRKQYLGPALAYSGVTLFSGIFTVVYYLNSHGLTDIWMTLLFVPGLVASLLFLMLAIAKMKLPSPTLMTFSLSFALLWCYQCLNGIYHMAKVESSWLWLLIVLSGIGFTATIALVIVKARKSATKPD